MRLIGRAVRRLLGRPHGTDGPQDLEAAVRRLEDRPPYQRSWLAQVLIGGAVLAGSSPVELAVPISRAAVRLQGVQTGAALGSLLSFVSAYAYTTAVRRAVTAESDGEDAPDEDHPLDRLMTRAVFAGAVVLPAAGALLPGTVVLRRRSPLWGLPLWLVVRFAAALVMAVDASRLARNHQAEEGTAPGPR